MTLSRDVARCWGDDPYDMYAEAFVLREPCKDCLRRTFGHPDGTVYKFMNPPQFDPDGSCPLRIPPTP